MERCEGAFSKSLGQLSGDCERIPEGFCHRKLATGGPKEHAWELLAEFGEPKPIKKCSMLILAEEARAVAIWQRKG